MDLKTRALTPLVGTEVQTDSATVVSGTYAAALRNLLKERGVLCFPGVHLSESEQVRFARTLGTVSDEAPHGIFVVAAGTNPDRKLANYQCGSFYWHFDGFERDRPFLATILNPCALSKVGGQTEIANLSAAFDALPDDEKKYLETLRVVHSFEAVMRLVTPSPGYAELAEWQKRPEKIHPLVWTHGPEDKSLVIGASASHIEGMTLREGRALLCRLCEWATQPQYVYQHEWQLGDLIVWDNTRTLHRAVHYPLDSGRTVLRTTLAGEEAVA